MTNRITLFAVGFSLVLSVAAEAQQVTAPAAQTVVTAGADWATRTFQDPMDMAQWTDLPGWVYASDQPVSNLTGIVNNSPCTTTGVTTDPASNCFRATSNAGDPKIEILETGQPSAADPVAPGTRREGLNFPIDASTYKTFAIRMRMATNASECPPRLSIGQCLGAFEWNRTSLYDNTLSATGGIFMYDGWGIYLFDLPTIALNSGAVTWAGSIGNMRIKLPRAAQTNFEVDWIRMVPNNLPTETITWSGFPGTVDLYLDNDTNAANGDLGFLVTNIFGTARNLSGTSFQFQPGALAPGDYYVKVCRNDDPQTSSNCRYSTGYYRVNGTPTFTFTSPSPEGGEDFATAKLGNAWDMNALSDIDYAVDPALSGLAKTTIDAVDEAGNALNQIDVVQGTSLIGDPYLYPLWLGITPVLGRGVSTKIDSSQYHILTFEMGVKNKPRNINVGSIARIIWQVEGERREVLMPDKTVSAGNPRENVSNDIIVEHRAGAGASGNVVAKVITDMKTLRIETDAGASPSTSGWTGLIEGFRVDPHEFLSEPVQFFVKRVKLAANERPTGGVYTIAWTYADVLHGPAPTLTLSYDTDTNPASGLTPIASGLNPATSSSYAWSTGALPAGTYYVYASFSDGVNTNAAYSRWPILIAAGPAISTHPTSQTVASGATTTFTVGATGSPEPRYQWQVSTNGGSTWTNLVNSQPLVGSSSLPYVGVTTPTLTVSSITAGMSGYRYRAVVTNTEGTATSNSATLALNTIIATPSSLNFGATKASAASLIQTVTPPQKVTVTFPSSSGAWTAVANQPWVTITGGSGNGAGQFTVAINDPSNLLGGTGSAGATITISAPSISLVSTVSLALTVQIGVTNAAPLGSFDSPADGATNLSGSFPVTGWALDDVGVDRVEIWRDVVGTEPPSSVTPGVTFGKVYIANGLFVTGARPDVEAAYPAYPTPARAGWGYLLMSWGLPNQGNGTYKLYAFAFDKNGNATTLGTKTISGNNAQAVKPFGGLDVPAYGDTKSGSFYNFGWALTPNPNTTDPRSCLITNGNVFVGIDSAPLVAVDYGDARADIAGFFPGFSNTAGPSGAYLIDTTTLSNGTHQIGWFVVDNCGRADGIGSRFFDVLNGGTSAAPVTSIAAARSQAAVVPTLDLEPVNVKREDGTVQQAEVNSTGTRVISVAMGERIEVQLPSQKVSYAGYHVVDDQRRSLPVGSSLDAKAGVFYWAPGPGFLGNFDLAFVQGSSERAVNVRVTVGPPMRTVIDAPAPGYVSQPFAVSGWTIDLAGQEGTGIDTVHVWAHPIGGETPIFLGVAAYGDARPDVGKLYGASFTQSSYTVGVSSLPPGTYDLVVYPHRASTGTFEGAQVVRVTVR
jgi:hypothetical protein